MPKYCKLCEGTIRRGKAKTYDNSNVDPPIHMEVCSSCYIWTVRKFRNFKPVQNFSQAKRKRKKLEIKKKSKLYKR